MKLNRVDIKNFRSIKNISVEFEPTCRVLVGINESGKSNILAALSLLHNNYAPDKKIDLREALQGEKPISESHVRFIFKFEKNDTDQLIESVLSKILCATKNPNIVAIKNKNCSLKTLCQSRDEGLYSVNILEENKSFMYWSFHGDYKLLQGWVKPTSDCPKELSVELKGKQYVLSKYSCIRAADFPDLPDEFLEKAEIGDISKMIGSSIIEIVKENLPDTLFWEYDEEYLLPNSVSIDEFSSDPDSCIPLKNMFTLAGIDDIKGSIEDARARSDNYFLNYFERISQATTAHFRSVWKEYRTIEFSFRLNGDKILPGIKEKNTQDFSKRSDGFKRFVTFLLMISVNFKMGNFVDTLLLIDEPDIGLHPSGARYLRDELIKISKTNYVVFSTHSIFMIDSGNIGRHVLVRKKDEITDIESAEDSNISDEEVLYNALGHSVFSVLAENNLIFEGWKDKHLFQTALKSCPTKIKRKFDKVGLCHAKGVGTIKTITPMIELANRKCLILSDSDKPAKDQQALYRREKGYGEWKNYQDVDKSIEAITGEDFVKNDFISKYVNVIAEKSAMPKFAESLPDKGKLSVIYNWLIENGMTSEQAKGAINEIKESVCENLKPQYIEDKYQKFLKGILF